MDHWHKILGIILLLASFSLVSCSLQPPSEVPTQRTSNPKTSVPEATVLETAETTTEAEETQVETSVFETTEPATQPEETKQETTTPETTEAPTSLETKKPEPEPWKITIVDERIHSSSTGKLESYGDFDARFLQDLEEKLKAFPGKIAVVCSSLDGEKTLCFNSDMEFHSQCTVKAAYVYALCLYMEANQLDLNRKLTYTKEDYLEGAGNIKDEAVGTQYTIRDLIQRCLSISDNIAYKILIREFGTDIENQLVEAIGCPSLKIKNGLWATKTKPRELVYLWEKIYEYFQGHSEYVYTFRNACSNTKWCYMHPQDKEYAHKSGSYIGQKHDACLVFDRIPYITVVFTSASSDDGLVDYLKEIGRMIGEQYN